MAACDAAMFISWRLRLAVLLVETGPMDEAASCDPFNRSAEHTQGMPGLDTHYSRHPGWMRNERGMHDEEARRDQRGSQVNQDGFPSPD